MRKSKNLGLDPVIVDNVSEKQTRAFFNARFTSFPGSGSTVHRANYNLLLITLFKKTCLRVYFVELLIILVKRVVNNPRS